ncbi:MAG TPA: DnaB-like helicase N-terminal domain-containing protein, partial [Planctomycetota bacterium]|nr:DnaB-like helicase N-terminal domain-containing protein [Planctomycetota bacterium]
MTSPAAAARAAIDRRAPPHDVASEQAVFRALIYEPSSFALASAIVSTDDFYETRHQLLWGVIAASNAEGASPDAALLADLVGRNGIGQKIGGEAYLAELARDGLPSATLVEHHARIVKERSIRRKVLAAGQALSEAAHTPGLDVKAFVSEETEYLREVLAEA